MKCPHCKNEIILKDLPKEELKSIKGAIGGMLGRRTITKEQQDKMQAAKRGKE